MRAWLSEKAFDWIALKEAVQSGIGLDRDATHVVASIVLLMAFGLIARRQLGNWLPWTGVLVAQLANEAASSYADGTLEGWELRGSAGDILLVMAMPTLLLLACRFTPRLFGRVHVRAGHLQRVLPHAQLPRPTETIVDAEFEEIVPPGPARRGRARP